MFDGCSRLIGAFTLSKKHTPVDGQLKQRIIFNSAHDCCLVLKVSSHKLCLGCTHSHNDHDATVHFHHHHAEYNSNKTWL